MGFCGHHSGQGGFVVHPDDGIQGYLGDRAATFLATYDALQDAGASEPGGFQFANHLGMIGSTCPSTMTLHPIIRVCELIYCSSAP